MLKNWKSKRQKIFSVPLYDFQLFEIWCEAFKAARPVWLKLLAADLIFIIVFHSPTWMLSLDKYFPFLENFRIHPTWLNLTHFSQVFSQLSVVLLPLLFALFVSVPVYLGLNLLALRAAYERPTPLSLLGHYLSFFWWSTLVTLFILLGLIVVPMSYVMWLFFLKAQSAQFMAQFYVGMSISCLLIVSFLVMWCWVLNLVFVARINIVDALRMSARAVKMHFWKIFFMLVILNVVQNLGVRTHYPSDILLFPPSMLAWALLYKRIFGEKGLIE